MVDTHSTRDFSVYTYWVTLTEEYFTTQDMLSHERFSKQDNVYVFSWTIKLFIAF